MKKYIKTCLALIMIFGLTSPARIHADEDTPVPENETAETEVPAEQAEEEPEETPAAEEEPAEEEDPAETEEPVIEETPAAEETAEPEEETEIEPTEETEEPIEDETEELETEEVESMDASANELTSTTNSYYEQMSSSDKAKIGTVADYSLNGKTVYSYLPGQTVTDGQTYAISVNGSSASNQNYWNLCTSPNDGGWTYTWSNRYKYLANILRYCAYYGAPNNSGSTYLNKAINTYKISSELAPEAVRLATQLAIWYSTNTSYSAIDYKTHSSYSSSMGDPVFCLAGDIAKAAYDASGSSTGNTIDVYKNSTSGSLLLNTRYDEPEKDSGSGGGEGGDESETTGSGVTITGSVIVDGDKPGTDNIFTFAITSADGTNTYATAQNDTDGNITFNVNLVNGTYLVKQVPTTEELQAHTNMTFDQTDKTITISGMTGSTGADWIVNGNTYSASGGPASKNPITILKSDGKESVYAYCIYNDDNTPYDYERTHNNAKPTYKAIFPVSTLNGYSEKSGADIASVKKVVYYYTVNDVTDWDIPESMIGYLTSGTSLTLDAQNMWSTVMATSVPDNFELVLLDSQPSGIQNLVTGFVRDTRQVTGTVRFANVTAETSGVTAEISALKMMDGTAASQSFTFALYNPEGVKVAEATNDSKGKITFELTYTEAGTYEYTMKEIAGTDSSINYDKTTYPVTVVVNANDLYELSASVYYSYKKGNEDYYISDDPNDAAFSVYCVDPDAVAPASPTNTNVQYDKYENPDNDTLAKYVGTNLYGDNLAENLRKLVYYLDINPDHLTANNKQTLMNAATSSDSSYHPAFDEKLNTIFAMTIPDNYELYLFVPKGYSKSDSSRKQTLLGGKGATVTYNEDADDPTVPTFRNTTKKTGIDVSIKAHKTLDGAASSRAFTFGLYDGDTKVAEAANDTSGNITFTMNFTSPGTYTYTMKEIAGTDTDITYDTTEYPVTIVVDQNDTADLSASVYYSVQGSDQGYYVSSTAGNTDFQVYCIDIVAMYPKTTSDTTRQYTVIENPDSATLANYVTTNRYGTALAENLRKLLYFLDLHSGEYIDSIDGEIVQKTLTESEKKYIIWSATNTYNTNNDAWLAKVFAMDIPDDYELVLFAPVGYVHGSQTTPQPLLGGRGSVVKYNGNTEAPTFANTTNQGTVLNLKANKYLNDQLMTGNKKFTFKLYQADRNWNYDETDLLMTVNNDGSSIEFNNVASFSLSDLGSTFYYVAVEANDSVYTIDPEEKHYTVSVGLNVNTLVLTVKAGNGTKSYTNTDQADFYNYTKVIPTGVNSGNMKYPLILLGMAAILAVIMAVRLKKKPDHTV